MTVQMLTFRAPVQPTSIDEKARTVELIASTGSGVVRFDSSGAFTERLAVTSKAIDLARAEGMPLLDSHRQDGLDRVLGVVRGIRFENGALIVKVEFSARAEAIWQDVKAGIIRNVSIGYAPLKWLDSKDAEGARVRTVTQWELQEVSLVPVGADPAAKVRGQSVEPETQAEASPPQTTQQPAATTRAETNQEIRALGTLFSLGADWSNTLIDEGASVETARAAAIEAVRAHRPARQVRVTAVGGHDAPEAFVRDVSEAIYARANPRHELPERARAYYGMTLPEVARSCLTRAGVSTTGMTQGDAVTRALGGSLTTSDFPTILQGVGDRALREAYQLAPATLKKIARQSTARDFRAKTKVQAADLAKLQKVNEAGEYKYSGFVEAKETYSIGTYGTIVSLSRQAIINDDLGAFLDLAGKMGLAAAEFEAQTLVDLLTSSSGTGPTMDDGKAVFHADHGNVGTAAVLSATSLTAARLAMRRQKGINGRPLAITPKYLAVPPELETLAETILSAVQATRTADVNPFGGKLELLVEARLADPKRWYVVADPALIDGLEYSYLQGAEGPQTESRAGFEVDGVEVKVRLDFGAAFLDFRGFYTNPGQ